MIYTDPTLDNTTPIKKIHVQELETAVKNMITDKKVSGVTVGTMDYSKVKASNVVNLQKAINALETKFSNNCCESNHCQTCQSNKCEKCQEACAQCSSKCEKCQESCAQCTAACQTCQRCQSQCAYYTPSYSCYSCGDCGCSGD